MVKTIIQSHRHEVICCSGDRIIHLQTIWYFEVETEDEVPKTASGCAELISFIKRTKNTLN